MVRWDGVRVVQLFLIHLFRLSCATTRLSTFHILRRIRRVCVLPTLFLTKERNFARHGPRRVLGA